MLVQQAFEFDVDKNTPRRAGEHTGSPFRHIKKEEDVTAYVI